MELNTEAIMALAPDSASASAGRKNSSAKLWKDPGRNESAIWGQCQGSAVYQVKIDQRHFAYNCSCPSRKLPCKHVLGLLLLACETPAALGAGDQPEWVTTWLDKREATAKKREEKSAQQPAEATEESAQSIAAKQAAKAKRANQRELSVIAGVEQLDLFLSDLMRQGLAGLEKRSRDFWEQPAKRLVDAQAKGLANRVRRLSEIPGSGANWPERMLTEISRLQLLSHASKRIDKLNPQLASEVRQQIGWAVSADDLAASGESVMDDWLVVGQENDIEEKLRVQKSWLWGSKSGRLGCVIQFAVAKTAFAESYLIGSSFNATATFYPGTSKYRLAISNPETPQQPIERGSVTAKGVDIAGLLQHASSRLALQPWLEEVVVVLSQMQVIPTESSWHCVDRAGHSLPLRGGPYWNCLAETGGSAVDLLASWNFHRLKLISALYSDRVVDLSLRSD